MKATEMPELRARVMRWLASPESRRQFRGVADSGKILPGFPETSKDLRGKGDMLNATEGYRWRDAQLFYVTPEMTDLAVAAGRSLPTVQLLEEDLPAPVGTIYFTQTINRTGASDGEAHIVAASWSVVAMGVDVSPTQDRQPREDWLWVTFWGSTPNDRANHSRRLGALVAVPGGGSFGPMGATIWPLGATDERDEAAAEPDSPIHAMRVIRTAWLLMQQPFATVATATPRKADLKRMRRHNVDPAAVRVISLRRTMSPAADVPDGAGRTYDHRWLVRGHWRKQWYPSRNDHLPIWISPHVKGPDGAPLLTGEKVNAWRR